MVVFQEQTWCVHRVSDWCGRRTGVLCAVGMFRGGVRMRDKTSGWYDMVVLEVRGWRLLGVVGSGCVGGWTMTRGVVAVFVVAVVN
jgi:hypothetical protein